MRFHHLSGASFPMIAIVAALAAAPLPATAVLSAESLDAAVEELSGLVAYWSEGVASYVEDYFDSCVDADECGYEDEVCSKDEYGADMCTDVFYSCGRNMSFWESRDALFAATCTYAGYVAVSVCNPVSNPPTYVGVDQCDKDFAHLDGLTEPEGCDDDACKEPVAAKYLTDDYDDGTDWTSANDDDSSGVSKIMNGVALPAALLGNTTVTLGSTAGAFVAWKPKVIYSSFAVNGSADTSVLCTDVTVIGGIVSFDGGSAIVGGGVTDEASLVSFKSSLPVRLEGLENSGSVTFTDCADVIIANTLNLGTVVLTNSVASVSNITNRGTIEISEGTYLYSGGSNDGTITVSGNVDAELVSDTNAGTIEVSNAVGGSVSATIGSNDGTISVLAGSTATAVIDTNVGTITVSDSCTGTLAVTCNTGTITYAGNVITGDFSDGSVTITILGTCPNSFPPTPQPAMAPTSNDDDSTDDSDSGGTCYSSMSKVKVLRTGKPVFVKLSEAKVGEKVLTSKGKYSKIKALPKSESTGHFVRIKTEGGFEADVTPHHTFPSCDGNRAEVGAKNLKVGDCLMTVAGKRKVRQLSKVEATAEDKTFSVVLEGSADVLTLGGILTHANPLAHQETLAKRREAAVKAHTNMKRLKFAQAAAATAAFAGKEIKVKNEIGILTAKKGNKKYIRGASN